MKRLFVTLVLWTLACSGEQPAQTGGGGGNAPATPGGAGNAPVTNTPTTPPSGRATGTVHDVNMEAVKGKFLFTPATLTIKSGDVVRFHNLSGGPHNIQFKKDRIPASAAQVLNGTMPNRISELTGPFLTEVNAVYEVSFVNAPPGSYTYSCQPHEIMGMTGMLTVTP